MIERNSIKEEKKVVKVVLSGCGWWARNRTIFPYMAENPTKIQIIDIIDLIGGQKEYEDIRNDLIAINERRNLEKSITKEEFVKIGFHDNTEPKSAFHECYEEKDEFYVLKQRIYKKDVKRLIEFFDNQTNIEFRLVKEKINIPTFQGNKKFSDYLEKVANGEIEKADAIIINTPNSRHFGVASEALRQNMHVYAERPISSSRHYIGELVELARDNRLLYTGVQRRLEDTFKYMYYVVRNQVNFGTLSRINIILYSGRELDDWRKNFELVGGGIIIDEGYHLLDAACWIYSASYDSDFKSISKSDVNLELDINYDLFPELKEEESRSGKIETSAKGRIKLPNNVILDIDFNYHNPIRSVFEFFQIIDTEGNNVRLVRDQLERSIIPAKITHQLYNGEVLPIQLYAKKDAAPDWNLLQDFSLKADNFSFSGSARNTGPISQFITNVLDLENGNETLLDINNFKNSSYKSLECDANLIINTHELVRLIYRKDRNED